MLDIYDSKNKFVWTKQITIDTGLIIRNIQIDNKVK